MEPSVAIFQEDRITKDSNQRFQITSKDTEKSNYKDVFLPEADDCS